MVIHSALLPALALSASLFLLVVLLLEHLTLDLRFIVLVLKLPQAQ